jgi:hypothetical protein
MTAEPVTLKELTQARETLIHTLVGKMPEAHRQFLVSFERGTPEWSLLKLPAAQSLPAVRWKQHNLGKLKTAERNRLVSRLESVLS